MIVVYATDRSSQRRQPWPLDFRGIEEVISASLGDLMSHLTDCVWFVPGTLSLD